MSPKSGTSFPVTMFSAHYLGLMRDTWDAYGRAQLSNFSSIKPESARLLDEDPYQAGYGYGALNHAHQASQPDSEYVRREREALESICQRTSE